MAGRHVGIDIGLHVDESPLDRVNQRIDRTKANAEQLSQTMGRIKVPGSASEGFDRINRASGEATSKVKGLTDAYKQVGTNSNLNRASGELNNLTSKAGKAASSTDKLKQSMSHASDQSKAMGNMGSAFDKARASSDHARSSIDKTTDSSGKLHSGWEKLKGAGSSLVQVGSAISAAMVPVAAAFMHANDQAIKLADEYNVIKNLQETGGDSARAARHNTKAIQTENRRLSLRYGVSQNELAAGSEQLLRRGYSGKQDLAAHKYFLQAARATNEDYNTIVASAAPMLEQFGYKAKAGNSVGRMSKYTRDVLNKASYVADITAGNVGGQNGFGESFKMMGSAAHSNGQSIDTVLGALGTLSNFGEEGSSAGTGMRQIITMLIKAPGSTRMSSALSDLGINPQSLYTRSGKLKQLGTIFGMFNRAARGKKSNRVSRDLQALFGQTGFNDAQILMAHAGNMQQNVQDSKKAARSGYISELSAKNMKSLKNQIARTQALASDLGNTFAKEVDPGMGKALGSANNLLKAFMGMPEPLKKASAYILGAVGALGASRLASGFLKANFGIGNGKGLGAGIGRLIFGKKLANQPRDELGRFTGGQAREGGLINAIKGNTWGGAFQSLHSAGGFRNLSTAGRITTGLAGAGVAIDAGASFLSAYKDRHNANKRSQDIGAGIGAGIGGGIGLWLGGPAGAAIGAKIGGAFGKWGGGAVNRFTKGWQAKKPPKKFWSMANFGWSTHDTLSKIGKWGGQVGKKFGTSISKGKTFIKKNGKELALTAVSPLIGIPALLYKNNPKFRKAVNSVFSNVKAGWKGVKTWFKNIPSNLGKTGAKIKNWAGRVGTNIHKGWNKGIKTSHNFFKNLPGNMSKFGKSMQRKWNGTWKDVNNNRYVKAFKKGKFIQTASKDIQSRWKSFSTKFGKSWNATWEKTQKSAAKSWDKTKHNASKTWGNIKSGWNSFSTKFGKSWNAGWNGFNNARYVKAFKKGEFFSTALKDIQSRWRAFSTDFGKKWNGFWGGLSKGWNKFWGGMGDWAKKRGNNLKAFGNDLDSARGGSGKAFKYTKINSHANGGAMHSTHAALVGEAGPELAYTPWGNHARILGANGPQLDKVHPGEKILNARDTAKVMHGGLGYGLVLNGYANGTTNLRQTSRNVTASYKKITGDATKSLRNLTKNSNSSWSKIKSGATKSLRGLTRSNNSSWSKIKSGATKQVTGLARTNNSTWSRIAKQTNKQTAKTRHDAVSDYTGMRKGVNKQMDSLHDGVIKLAGTTSKGFGKELGRMKGYAHSAMSGTIGQVNKGISGIDKVLGQFGGNASVIKPVKFATGTDSNGRLTRDTYAMVNDATNGPRQEALVSDKNEVFMPRGHNVKMMIPRGWGVLNGKQTQQAGLQHFAKGSGLSHSALRKLAEKSGANPAQSFKSMYLSSIKPSGSDLKQGSIGLAAHSSTHFGNPWSNAMWTVINNAIGGANGKGGTREAFLKYAESTFTGVKYQLGAASRTLADCSGMVMQALRHFGINIGRTTVAMQESSGAQYLGKSVSKTLPGDLVIFGHGTGAAGHVGIIKNPKTGTMFNETQPRAHVSRISDDESMGYGFYRVRGLHNAKRSSKLSASKSLEALAKRELGSRALKWIDDNLADQDLSGLVAGKATGDHAHWLKQAHIPEKDWSGINYIVSHESGWNPRAVNPTSGTYGLGQMQGYNLHYYTAHGAKSNSIAQLMGIMDYIHDRYGTVSKAVSYWQRNHAYAKGGNHYGSGVFLVGENGPELISSDGKTHIDNADQTKKKLSDLFDEASVKKSKPIKVKRPNSSSTPTINININGPISNTEDATRVANIVRQEVARVLENVGDEFGTDLSVY
ncbi:phage tail tape measure protein [Lactobacillus helveticus]|nr:phage tail tape measure protein [Lactobacillus helveticus]MCT0164384.1 phage tail tape measure protein [Lactobacillus helveticus]